MRIRDWRITYVVIDVSEESYIEDHMVYAYGDHYHDDGIYTVTKELECYECGKKAPIDVMLEYNKLIAELKNHFPDYKFHFWD